MTNITEIMVVLLIYWPRKNHCVKLLFFEHSSHRPDVHDARTFLKIIPDNNVFKEVNDTRKSLP